MTYIAYPPVYKHIAYTSQLFLVSSIIGYVNKVYDLANICGIVYITSASYWVNPDNSYKRYIDIFAVQLSIYYHWLRAIESNKSLSFYILSIMSSFFGLKAFDEYKNQHYRISTLYHMLMHIGTNMSLHILYTSKIPQYRDSIVITDLSVNIIIYLSIFQMIGLLYFIDK